MRRSAGSRCSFQLSSASASALRASPRSASSNRAFSRWCDVSPRARLASKRARSVSIDAGGLRPSQRLLRQARRSSSASIRVSLPSERDHVGGRSWSSSQSLYAPSRYRSLRIGLERRAEMPLRPPGSPRRCAISPSSVSAQARPAPSMRTGPRARLTQRLRTRVPRCRSRCRSRRRRPPRRSRRDAGEPRRSRRAPPDTCRAPSSTVARVSSACALPRVALQYPVEVRARGVELVPALQDRRAQHQHWRRCLGVLPPRRERRLRVAEKARIALDARRADVRRGERRRPGGIARRLRRRGPQRLQLAETAACCAPGRRSSTCASSAGKYGAAVTRRERMYERALRCRASNVASRAKSGPGIGLPSRVEADAASLRSAYGTSGPHGLAPGPVSSQSTCRRFLPSYGVGRNGKFFAMPFAVMSVPTSPGAPARKFTPSPALLRRCSSCRRPRGSRCRSRRRSAAGRSASPPCRELSAAPSRFWFSGARRIDAQVEPQQVRARASRSPSR